MFCCGDCNQVKQNCKFLFKADVIKLIKFDELQFRMLLQTEQHNSMISMLQRLIHADDVYYLTGSGLSPQMK